jgi:hypothetical protein|uniref:DUF1640 domain-containing protein n=1 Tax=Hydrogenobacter sp. TaxID=2152829 RepID=A0A7C2ZI01_9AQUI
MPHLTVEVLQLLEEKLGKEEAKKVAEAIEIALESIEDKAKEVAIQKKLELKEELTKELITKAEFYGEIRLIKQEIEALRQEMRTLKTELEAKIENEILKLDRKFTILFLILLFAIIFLNKEALEFIAKLFGLIK